jgi:uncharacterized protein (TIGR03067 family)
MDSTGGPSERNPNMHARRVFFASIGVLLVTAAAAGDDAGNAVRGIWAVESLSLDGRPITDDPTAGAQLTAFDGKNYVQRKGVQITEEGTYVLTGSNAIDMVVGSGADAGKRQLGIYQVQGNTLRVCLAEPGVKARPKSFQAGSGSGLLLAVYRKFQP